MKNIVPRCLRRQNVFFPAQSAKQKLLAFGCSLFLLVVAAQLPSSARAQNEAATAQAGTYEDYTIAVFLSSQPGTVIQVIDAIKHFSQERADDINARGGINGRRIKLLFLDDDEEVEKTIANVETALSDERLIAMVGIWNSTRGAEVIERVGKSGVPLISEISVNSLFASHNRIFTLTRAVDDEIRVFKRFVEKRYKRAAFLGLQDDLYTQAYEQALREIGTGVELVASDWVPNQDELDDAAADQAIQNIKQNGADFLCLSIGSGRGAAFIEKMIDAGVNIPVFVGAGSAERILKVPVASKYSGRIYQITDGVPYVDNERLAQLARKSDFTGAGKNYGRDAVGYGVRYGDILAMIADAGKSSKSFDVVPIREHIANELSRFRAGKEVYRGLWQDWAFTPNRASAETPLLVWRPENHKKLILAPIQHLNTGAGWTDVPVLYVNLDMDRIFRIDRKDKSFHAEFYFAMRSDLDVDIDAIEFTNAYRGEVSNQPLISIREIHSGNAAAGFDPGVKLYKISGKFMFQPDLANFPFDQQQFSISFQPVSTASPFFIQPPKPALRDRDFVIDDWSLEDEYVGLNQDIISTIQNYASETKIISFYKFNYTWIVQRLAVDYYLRVVFPLLFILIVVYFSIFIPDERFESVVALQVTALLSTIALYLAFPKLDSDTATLSDQIFVFTEMVIAIMIALSICRVNTEFRKMPALGDVLAFAQGIVFPLMVAGLFGYVVLKSSGEELSFLSLANLWSDWVLGTDRG